VTRSWTEFSRTPAVRLSIGSEGMAKPLANRNGTSSIRENHVFVNTPLRVGPSVGCQSQAQRFYSAFRRGHTLALAHLRATTLGPGTLSRTNSPRHNAEEKL
jgi:hypothetical protein